MKIMKIIKNILGELDTKEMIDFMIFVFLLTSIMLVAFDVKEVKEKLENPEAQESTLACNQQDFHRFYTGSTKKITLDSPQSGAHY